MTDVKIRSAIGQKGIAKFTAQLNAADARIKGRLGQVAQQMAFIVAEAVVVGNQYGPGTPVDTGFARANWATSLNSEPSGELTERPEGDAKYPTPEITVPGMKLGDVFRMANNAVYAGSLEFGHSKQAPAGMVRIVIAAGQTIADDLVKSMRNGTVSEEQS